MSLPSIATMLFFLLFQLLPGFLVIVLAISITIKKIKKNPISPFLLVFIVIGCIAIFCFLSLFILSGYQTDSLSLLLFLFTLLVLPVYLFASFLLYFFSKNMLYGIIFVFFIIGLGAFFYPKTSTKALQLPNTPKNEWKVQRCTCIGVELNNYNYEFKCFGIPISCTIGDQNLPMELQLL